MSEFKPRELAEASIVRIRANTRNDSPFFTEFDDLELIEMWKGYLRSLEVKKIPKPFFKIKNPFWRNRVIGGWGKYVFFSLKGEGKPVGLVFKRDGTITFGGREYRVVSGGKCPLDATCRELVKRHGEFADDGLLPMLITPGEQGTPTLEELERLAGERNGRHNQ